MKATRSARRGEASEARLSIGALSRATGIPIETLRTWERRYEFPVPMRKPSGHRVYPLSAVPRLRRVAEAIARGHRAAEILPISERALEDLLHSLSARRPGARPAAAPAPIPSDTPADLGDLMAPVTAFDSGEFRRRLELRWLAQGPIPFLDATLTPFLRALGSAWERSDLDVRHEHFASARVSDFLREVRRPHDEAARGPRAAFLTLPDDLHELGLLMASLVFAIAGWRILYMGPSTPPDQAGALARDARLDAVAVSISAAYRRERADEGVRALRRAVPRALPVLLGGTGAPEARLKNVVRFGGWPDVQTWADEHFIEG